MFVEKNLWREILCRTTKCGGQLVRFQIRFGETKVTECDMTCRVDHVISMVRERHTQWKLHGKCSRDVVIVAHGHFNRCMIARWLGMPLIEGTKFNYGPGGVSMPTLSVIELNTERRAQIAVLGYNHDNLDEPALTALNLNAEL